MTVIRQSSPFPSSFFKAGGGGIVMAGKELAGCPYPRTIAMKSRFRGYRQHGARLELNRSRGWPERVLTTDNTKNNQIRSSNAGGGGRRDIGRSFGNPCYPCHPWLKPFPIESIPPGIANQSAAHVRPGARRALRGSSRLLPPPVNDPLYGTPPPEKRFDKDL
jgi:hypothetical protein